ncbi:hypothetical protein CapIbe_008312 [Capra ibex]
MLFNLSGTILNQMVWHSIWEERSEKRVYFGLSKEPQLVENWKTALKEKLRQPLVFPQGFAEITTYLKIIKSPEVKDNKGNNTKD